MLQMWHTQTNRTNRFKTNLKDVLRMSISESQIKKFVREELKRILDAGLLYTEGCTPVTVTTTGPPASQNVIDQFPEPLRKHLSEKDGKIYTEYVSRERWGEINEAAKTLGYKWVKDTADPKQSHWGKQ
jgi:hypothetical protein